MTSIQKWTSNTLGLLGAIAGGFLGHFLFFWFLDSGFYAMILPGALMGIGCGALARHRSVIRGALCGLAALLLGFHTEWLYRPFKADHGFLYFLTHITLLTPVTLIMIAVGSLSGYWFGKDGGFATSFLPTRRSLDSRP